MELDIGVAVPVLDADYKTSHGCHTRKISERILVRVLGILLAGRYELVVEVQIYTVTWSELSCGLQTPEHQGVHLGGDIELVCLSGPTAVTGVILAELAQCAFYRIRTCDSYAVSVPEGLDVHNILDAVSSREVAAKQ
jgi:hypothetical protein